MSPHQTTLTTLDGEPDQSSPSSGTASSSNETEPDTAPDTTSTDDTSAEQDTEGTSSPDTPDLPDDISEDEITTLTAQETVDEWTSAREAGGDDYAFLHVEVDVYRTLTNTWAGLRVNTTEKILDPKTTYGGGFSWSQPNREDLVDVIIDWVSQTLATPYVSPGDHDLPAGHYLRSYPHDHVRVFISAAAVEFLTDHDIPVAALQEAINDIEEHTAPRAYCEQVTEYYAARDALDDARSQIRTLKTAIGAAFDIPTRYRTQPPKNFPEEYADLSPNELQSELAAARTAEEAAKSQRDTLQNELTTKQEAWASEISARLRGRVEAILSTDTSPTDS